jgi:hypothetical protein
VRLFATYRFGYAVAIVEIGFDCLCRYLKGLPVDERSQISGGYDRQLPVRQPAQPIGTNRLNFLPDRAILSNNKVRY